jgi:hypothetical protein
VAELIEVYPEKKFDPEGSGYDYDSAIAAGYEPDEEEHWPSRDEETGLLFKGTKHETWNKTIETEKKLGYVIVKGKDGRYYSFKPDDKRIKEVQNGNKI